MDKMRFGRVQVVESPPTVDGRVPPHDLDAEAAVISAVMLDPNALDKVLEFLKPEHFYSEAHRRIFEACLELKNAGQPVDVVQVGSWLKDRERIAQVGGMQYLTQILDSAPAVANIASYAKIIHEKCRVRQLTLVCQRVAAQAYIDYGEAQAFIDSAEQSIYEIARTRESNSAEKLLDLLKRSFKAIQDAHMRGGRITGISTGFTRYDDLTAGLHDGDLTIIAARPGMGKTSFVLNVAANVAGTVVCEAEPTAGQQQGERWEVPGAGVIVFSLEMPREQIANRMVCSDGRVDVSKLRSGHLGPQDWRSLTASASRLGRMPIWIDDSPGLSILELRAKVRRLQAEYERTDAEGKRIQRIGLVVVDYLQLMRGRDGVNSREQEISEIFPRPQGARQGAAPPGHRAQPAESRGRNTQRQVEAPAAVGPSRVGRHRTGRRQHLLHLPRRVLQQGNHHRAERRGAHHRQAAKRADRHGEGALRSAVDPLRQPRRRRIHRRRLGRRRVECTDERRFAGHRSRPSWPRAGCSSPSARGAWGRRRPRPRSAWPRRSAGGGCSS